MSKLTNNCHVSTKGSDSSDDPDNPTDLSSDADKDNKSQGAINIETLTQSEFSDFGISANTTNDKETGHVISSISDSNSRGLIDEIESELACMSMTGTFLTSGGFHRNNEILVTDSQQLKDECLGSEPKEQSHCIEEKTERSTSVLGETKNDSFSDVSWGSCKATMDSTEVGSSPVFQRNSYAEKFWGKLYEAIDAFEQTKNFADGQKFDWEESPFKTEQFFLNVRRKINSDSEGSQKSGSNTNDSWDSCKPTRSSSVPENVDDESGSEAEVIRLITNQMYFGSQRNADGTLEQVQQISTVAINNVCDNNKPCADDPSSNELHANASVSMDETNISDAQSSIFDDSCEQGHVIDECTSEKLSVDSQVTSDVTSPSEKFLSPIIAGSVDQTNASSHSRWSEKSSSLMSDIENLMNEGFSAFDADDKEPEFANDATFVVCPGDKRTVSACSQALQKSDKLGTEFKQNTTSTTTDLLSVVSSVTLEVGIPQDSLKQVDAPSSNELHANASVVSMDLKNISDAQSSIFGDSCKQSHHVVGECTSEELSMDSRKFLSPILADSVDQISTSGDSRGSEKSCSLRLRSLKSIKVIPESPSFSDTASVEGSYSHNSSKYSENNDSLITLNDSVEANSNGYSADVSDIVSDVTTNSNNAVCSPTDSTTSNSTNTGESTYNKIIHENMSSPLSADGVEEAFENLVRRENLDYRPFNVANYYTTDTDTEVVCDGFRSSDERDLCESPLMFTFTDSEVTVVEAAPKVDNGSMEKNTDAMDEKLRVTDLQTKLNEVMKLESSKYHESRESDESIWATEEIPLSYSKDALRSYTSPDSVTITADEQKQEVTSESSVIEKKSVKKKKSTSEQSSTSITKVKKTKKSEEKENISANVSLQQVNGHGHDTPPSFHRIVDDTDELSNVCVRDLKITYCKEVTKNVRKAQFSEKPVPPSVPIKELRRSFGDLREISHLDNDMNVTSNDMIQRLENTRKSEPAAQKSSFGKFDQLTKKTVLHVRSTDPAKVQQQFNQNESPDGTTCKECGKIAFVMEQVKAERHVWHKNCFRCKTCNKQLTVDIYSSHEGQLYCKPHFKDLFKPKVVVDDEPVKMNKPELIICENEPVALPPDVVRASDKPDLGLEGLSSLNVKSRFQVFEKPQVEESPEKSPVTVKRSASILSKLARFQLKGMDVGVPSDMFDGVNYEESSSDEEPQENGIKPGVKEKPIAFKEMDDVRKTWENGQAALKEERREERRQELQNIRSRLFMGKQGKMKEAYEQAVAESERGGSKRDVGVRSEKARLIKERFERGEVIHNEDSEEEEHDKNKSLIDDEMNVFEAGISKKSRTIFQQLDANVAKTQKTEPVVRGTPETRRTKEIINRQVSNDVVRSSDPVEEVSVETADISSRFKFFETYKPPEVTRKEFRITPPREGQLKSESPEHEMRKNPNPNVVRSGDIADDETELKKSHTTAKMLSFFRQMEEAQENVPDGPKPLKKFTPPPGCNSSGESEDESEEPSEENSVHDDVVRGSYKVEDEFLKQAQNATRAKALKEKFEHWEPEKHSNNNAIELLDGEQASIDTTKSLRARFESLHADTHADKPRPKVNRFVENAPTEVCETCQEKVYPLEKLEADGKVFHKNCFKCNQCNCVLRMETFTINNGHLYCVPHFKQLFIAKGNYDEGFGVDQHKTKWSQQQQTLTLNGGSH